MASGWTPRRSARKEARTPPVDAVRSRTMHLQTVAVEVNAMGKRVDAIEEGQ